MPKKPIASNSNLYRIGRAWGSADTSKSWMLKPCSVDASALSRVLLGIPEFLGSLVVVLLVSSVFLDGLWVNGAALAWIFSGALVIFSKANDLIARIFFRLRPPTGHEEQRLEIAWRSVLRSAGGSHDRYTLWVDDAAQVNAFAAGGNIVAVTRWALMSLPPRQLEAVLAHELGHHRGGHAWTLLVVNWYAVPARLFMSVLKRFTSVVFWVTAQISAVGFLLGIVLVGVLIFGWFGYGLSSDSSLVKIIVLGPLVTPLIMARVSRDAEIAADLSAAQMGYGRDLIAVFRRWQDEGHDVQAHQAGWLARLFASHPTAAMRIRSLEARMSELRR